MVSALWLGSRRSSWSEKYTEKPGPGNKAARCKGRHKTHKIDFGKAQLKGHTRAWQQIQMHGKFMTLLLSGQLAGFGFITKEILRASLF